MEIEISFFQERSSYMKEHSVKAKSIKTHNYIHRTLLQVAVREPCVTF